MEMEIRIDTVILDNIPVPARTCKSVSTRAIAVTIATPTAARVCISALPEYRSHHGAREYGEPCTELYRYHQSNPIHSYNGLPQKKEGGTSNGGVIIPRD